MGRLIIERREALLLLTVLLIGIVTGAVFSVDFSPKRNVFAHAQGEVISLGWGSIPVVNLGLNLVRGEQYMPVTYIEITTASGGRLVLAYIEHGALKQSELFLDGPLPNEPELTAKIAVLYWAYPTREVPWQDIVNAGLDPSYRAGFWGSNQLDGIVEAIFVLQ